MGERERIIEWLASHNEHPYYQKIIEMLTPVEPDAVELTDDRTGAKYTVKLCGRCGWQLGVGPYCQGCGSEVKK